MIFLLPLLACEPPDPPDGGWGTGPCADASRELGHLACVHDIETDARWLEVSVEAAPVDQVLVTKYAVPALDDAVPTFFLNSNLYELHSELLGAAFPDRYPDMTHADYVEMVLGDPRHYWSGNLASYIEPGGGRVYGFTIWDDPADSTSTIQLDEALTVFDELAAATTLRPLVFVPSSNNQRDLAETWGDAIPVRGESDLMYEVYTGGIGYGTLQLVELSELSDLSEAGVIGHQDILILDEAPLDIERVISGVVTGTRQAALSHLAVRTSARGTPNCFLDDAHLQLAAWDGQLVQLCCGSSGLEVREATLEEAEAHWDQMRPDPVDVPEPDLDERALVDLDDLPTSTEAERLAAVRAYGSKGTNLATLYERIPLELQLNGFVIPMAYSQEEVSDELLEAIREQAISTFGSDEVMVRFRSSSNAEDAVGFSGAGLYESTKVCPADSFDDDDVGPSLCDADDDDERTIERGLDIVWESLWTTRAIEERAWYGIDEGLVAMAILVNDRSKDEQVNAVAFSGVPGSDDDRFLVEAQIGLYDVVSNESGMWPERSLVDPDGWDIERVTESSEADEVLSDARLLELAQALAEVEAVFPIDGGDGSELLDTEWKVLSDGRLIIKQVRPFSR
ncbi:MAG: hypothetical protein GY913_33605 [Proteobacteria bacterium]|nr:hypothetical protein [Pseudomonadota bacterium]MCP4921864.1 hypothetical protein [Pseudomonadota bacterium]